MKKPKKTIEWTPEGEEEHDEGAKEERSQETLEPEVADQDLAEGPSPEDIKEPPIDELSEPIAGWTEPDAIDLEKPESTELEPEIPLRAQALRGDANEALRDFRSDIQSFRNQVKYRRKFILSELGKAKPAR